MKYLYIFVLSLCLAATALAQTPQGINYQGVARNAAGAELANQSIGLELSVVDGSPSGTAVYTEAHTVTTDANGLFAIVIGGGTPTSGTFAAINWATGGGKWLKVSMDISGGTSYVLMGSSQLLSVPYALYAGNVTNNGGKQTIVLSDDVTDSQATAIIAAEVGPNTQEIKIVGTTALTTVDLSMITTAIYIEISNNSALTSVDLSGLTRCDGPLVVQNSPVLSSLNISALAKITTGEMTFDNVGLTTLNLPALVKCNAYVNIGNNVNLTSVNLAAVTTVNNMYIEDNDALTNASFASLTTVNGELSLTQNPVLGIVLFPALLSTKSTNVSNNGLIALSFPALTQANSLGVTKNPNLTTISCPALTTVNGPVQLNFNNTLTSVSLPALLTTGSFGVSTNNLLATLNVSALSTTGSINVANNPVLASLAFTSLVSCGGSTIYINNSGLTSVSFPALTTFGNTISVAYNKLTVATVNALLNRFVSINPVITGKTINMNGQTPAAAPTGQGITDKNTLTTNGNTVYTD